MIAQRDLAWVSRIAPIAQLLEMMGGDGQCDVKTLEVFQVMARDLWEAYWYLSARMNDEILEQEVNCPDTMYFENMEKMAKRFSGK
jgi:hypothetical protein